MKQPLLSLRDVAREAGVHYTTVSRALHNDHRLPVETRQRIQEVAARLGYHSNPLVSNLISNLKRARLPPQFGVIGFLDTRSRAGALSRPAPNGQPFYEGAKRRAQELGYRLDLFQLHSLGMTSRRMGNILKARSIRGLIIDSHFHPKGHLSLDISPFSNIMRGYSNLRPNLNRVAHNHFQGILLAIHFLRRLGYRRPGLALMKALDRLTNHQWSAGFLVYQGSLPAAERVPLLLGRTSLKEEMMKWYFRHRPDVILGVPPIDKWLTEEGLNVPKQVGFANLDLDVFPDQKQAGIWQSTDGLGATAVDALTTQMQRNEFGIPERPKLTLQEGIWKEGPTVCPQRLPRK